MSKKASIVAAMVGLASIALCAGDASAFQRGFGGGASHSFGGHSFGGGFGSRGFGGRSFGGFAGRGGYRGYGHYAGYGHYGRGYRYGYGYPGYYGHGDDGAVAGAVIGGLALGALAAAAGGY